MIDLWRLARDFKAGDYVQRFWPTAGNGLGAFVGRVTASHPGLGVVDVQFPYGNDRLSADDLVKVDPKMCMFLPPEFDQSYSSYDITKATALRTANVLGVWRGNAMPRGFYTEVARAWSAGESEVAAYDRVWHKFASQGADDGAMQDEVGKFYRVSQRMVDLRINQHVHKTAAYWVAQNRQYRVSQGELTAKKPNCPKCGSTMRRTTYKMDKGARVRLFACPRDLFLIKTEAILGPLGEPVGW